MAAMISVLVDLVTCDFSMQSSVFRENCGVLYFEIQLESLPVILEPTDPSLAV